MLITWAMGLQHLTTPLSALLSLHHSDLNEGTVLQSPLGVPLPQAASDSPFHRPQPTALSLHKMLAKDHANFFGRVVVLLN